MTGLPSALYELKSIKGGFESRHSRVAQSAEAVDLKSIKCGFESRHGYRIKKKGNTLAISFRGTEQERRASTQRRFNKKWVPDQETGCWNWTGALKNKKRGRNCKGNMLNSLNGLVEDAPRVALGIYRPDVSLENIQIIQTCHNSACVNPDHLKTVPAGEGVSRGESHPNAKLDANTVRRLRKAREYNRGRVSLKDLAEKFNVSRETIRKVAMGMSSLLPEEVVSEIISSYKPFINVKSILPEGVHVTRPAIDRAVSGASWRHVHS